MPTYRYRCAKCGDELEEWQSFDDAPLVKHRGCGGKLAKVLTTPGIVLKGSGFYRTDNRNGAVTSSKRPERSGDGASSDSASKGDTSKGDDSKRGTSTDGEKAKPAKEAGAAT